VLRASDRAPGLALGEDVVLPHDVELGANVVIHAGTAIGTGVRVHDGAILGKPPSLGALSVASREEQPPLVLGDGVTVGAGAVLAAGAAVGPRVLIGDQVFLRERSAIGESTTVGRGTSIENDVVIGARVRIQTDCYITAFSTVEDDVFVAPCVMTSNDMSAGRRRGEPLRGPTLRRACRVGVGVVLLPAVEVGEEAFVGAGSVVTRDVAARSVAFGSPAKHVRDVSEEKLLST
jgi:acetyltransferase-like isoleucine patch superfamily enzyme